MRPRRIAAENDPHCYQVILDTRFNEAAANRRGKRRYRVARRTLQHASMRPRRIAAENENDWQMVQEIELASMRPRRIAAENVTD